MLNREKHTHLAVSNDDFNQKFPDLLSKVTAASNDMIIDLSQVISPDPDKVDQFVEAVDNLLEEWIVILVGEEDQLQEMGFLADDIPSTPTYNEALDYLYMMQLERELGDEE